MSTRAADLFALGVMLYEMLGGRHPFRGASTFETLHAILTTEPPDLSSVNRQVPPALTAIVTRLLKKAPDARFQSAADLAWALTQVTPVPGDVAAHRTPAGESATAKRPRWIRLGCRASPGGRTSGGWMVAAEGRRS